MAKLLTNANKLLREKGMMPDTEAAVLTQIEAENDLTVLLRMREANCMETADS